MIHLIVKDLRRDIWMIAAFAAFSLGLMILYRQISDDYSNAGALLDWSSLYVIIIMLIMLVYGTVMHVEKHEDKNSAYAFLRTLPISDREVVTAKFILLLFLDIIGVAYLWAAIRLSELTYSPISILPRYLITAGIVCLVFSGIIYLGIYRFGYMKMKAWIMVLYLAMLILPQAIVLIGLEVRGIDPLDSLMAKISGLNIPLVVCLGLLIYAGCLIGAISVKKRI